jgi:hypothetical protein
MIQALTEKLQQTMNQFEEGCFVKLSSRSAKDSSVSSSRTKQVTKRRREGPQSDGPK